LYAYGVIEKNSFVKRNILELKGQHVGATTPLIKGVVAEAMGGVLFLDEAYALVDTSSATETHSDPYSRDAIRTLLTEVENNRENLTVILAGYKDGMQRLMRADPGLPSRFPRSLHLPDYDAKELAQICKTYAKKRFDGVEFAPGLEAKLAKHIADFYAFKIAEGNGRLAANLADAAMEKHDSRLGATWRKLEEARVSGTPRDTSGRFSSADLMLQAKILTVCHCRSVDSCGNPSHLLDISHIHFRNGRP
jgi:Cdc6-like AAA superfamily ATPase